MDSKFTFRVDCGCDSDCEDECDCTVSEFDYVYEVTGYACGGDYFDGADGPFVDWDTVDTGDDEYESFTMEHAITQISADIENGIDHHFFRIGSVFYTADWEFEDAQDNSYRSRKTGKMVTDFTPSRLTIVLTEVDPTRVAAYV